MRRRRGILSRFDGPVRYVERVYKAVGIWRAERGKSELGAVDDCLNKVSGQWSRANNGCKVLWLRDLCRLITFTHIRLINTCRPNPIEPKLLGCFPAGSGRC